MRNGRHKRIIRTWVCALAALGTVLVFYKLYAGTYFFKRLHTGKGVFVLSASGSYVGHEPVMSLVVQGISTLKHKPHDPVWSPVFWRLGYAVGTVWPAAFIGALVFGVLLRRARGRAASEDGESRCRYCDQILRGLSKPLCPECGGAV